MANPYYPEDDADQSAAPSSSGLPPWASITSDLADGNDFDDAPSVAPPAQPEPVPPAATPQAAPPPPPAPQQPIPAPQAPPAAPAVPVPVPVPTPPPAAPQPVQRPVPPPPPVVAPSPPQPSAPSPTPTPPAWQAEEAEYDDTPFDPSLEDEENLTEDEDLIGFPGGAAAGSVAGRQRNPIDRDGDQDDEPAEDEPAGKRFSIPKRNPRPAREPKTATPKPSKKPLAEDKSGESKYAGGRSKVIIVRAVVWGTLGLVILLGIRQVIAPPSIDVEGVTATVSSNLGRNGFPIEQGQGLAERFTTAYLSLSDNSAREEQIVALLPGQIDAGSFRLGNVAKQEITQGPYMYRAPGLIDPEHTTFYFAAEVVTTPYTEQNTPGAPGEPHWVYLAVPVTMTDTGMAIGGLPAFVPAPPKAQTTNPLPFVEDPTASSAIEADMTGFLKAWSTSNTAEMSRYLSPEPSSSATTGLGGAVEFQKLDSVQVAAVDPNATDPLRPGNITVTWKYAGGAGTVQQQYRVWVLQGGDGRWYVQDIRGAGYNLG